MLLKVARRRGRCPGPEEEGRDEDGEDGWTSDFAHFTPLLVCVRGGILKMIRKNPKEKGWSLIGYATPLAVGGLSGVSVDAMWSSFGDPFVRPSTAHAVKHVLNLRERTESFKRPA